MLDNGERARTTMDASRDHRYRIAAAAQVDQYFENYEIEMGPQEALSFAATAPAAGSKESASVYSLIDLLNRLIPATDFGPSHPRTGASHHLFWLGRRHGERLLILELFKGYFSRDFLLDNLIDQIRLACQHAGANRKEESDETIYQIACTWPADKQP